MSYRDGVKVVVIGAVMLMTGCAGSPPPAAQSNAAQNNSGPPPARMADQYSVSLTLAEAAERSGDLFSAVTYYSQAISERKGGVKPYIRSGQILLQLGKPEQSAAVFESGLAAGYKNVELHRGYGRSLAWLGQAGPALKEYDIALRLAPGNIQSMNGRGVVLDMLDRHTEAQQQYIAAMTQAPGNLLVQNNLALSYALSGKLEDGIRLLERIESSGVASVQHRQNLALLYGLAGRTSDAERLARQDLGNERADQNLEMYARMHHLFVGQEGVEAQALPIEAAPFVAVPEPVPEPVAEEQNDQPAMEQAVVPVIVDDQSESSAAAVSIGADPQGPPEVVQPVPAGDDAVVDIVVVREDAGEVDLPVIVEPSATEYAPAPNDVLIPVTVDPATAEEIQIRVETSPSPDQIEVVPVQSEAIEVVIEEASDDGGPSGSDVAQTASGLLPGTVVLPSDGTLRSEIVAATDETKTSRASSASAHVPSDAGDWMIEIGPFESQAAAEAAWRTLQADIKGLVSGLLSNIQTTPAGTLLKLGPAPDFERARRLCNQVQEESAACVVRPY